MEKSNTKSQLLISFLILAIIGGIGSFIYSFAHGEEYFGGPAGILSMIFFSIAFVLSMLIFDGWYGWRIKLLILICLGITIGLYINNIHRYEHHEYEKLKKELQSWEDDWEYDWDV